MSQRSILGPLLFNIFLCDPFLILHDIPVTNYADGNVLMRLENAAEILLKWFKDNRMKINSDKYYLLINNTKGNSQIKISKEAVSNSKYEKSPRG